MNLAQKATLSVTQWQHAHDTTNLSLEYKYGTFSKICFHMNYFCVVAATCNLYEWLLEIYSVVIQPLQFSKRMLFPDSQVASNRMIDQLQKKFKI